MDTDPGFGYGALPGFGQAHQCVGNWHASPLSILFGADSRTARWAAIAVGAPSRTTRIGEVTREAGVKGNTHVATKETANSMDSKPDDRAQHGVQPDRDRHSTTHNGARHAYRARAGRADDRTPSGNADAACGRSGHGGPAHTAILAQMASPC